MRPEIGPNVRTSAASAAPVAIVFASSASATFPPASRSAMMPEPTTAATRNPVPPTPPRFAAIDSPSLLPDAIDFFLDRESVQTCEGQTQE
jgi:hypothetical protein